MTLRDRLRTVRARLDAARAELRALAVAMGDPRTPRYAKAIAGVTLALAASPIDPVPDFLPVVGYLDDLVFVPVGVYLARRAVPDPVLADAREAPADDPRSRRARLVGAALVVLGWAAVAVAGAWVGLRLLG